MKKRSGPVIRAQMLCALQSSIDGMTTTKVATAFGIDRRTARQHLYKLSEERSIKAIPDKRGCITWHAMTLAEDAKREIDEDTLFDEHPMTRTRRPPGHWKCDPINGPVSVFDLANYSLRAAA